MQPNTILNSAQGFQAAGLSIIPVNRTSKRPDFTLLPKVSGKPSWEPFQRELPSSDTLHTWFSRPGVNVGVVCGSVSGGLMVIDFDARADELFPLWMKLVGDIVEAFRLPVVRTGKGFHVYVRCDDPKGQTLALAADRKTKLVEVRGEGNYVVAPPSIHPTAGKPYEVIQGDILAVPFLDMPTVQQLLDAARAFDDAQPTPAKSQPANSSQREEAWIEAAFQGEVERVRNSGKGSRNDDLNKAAFALGQLVAAGFLDEATVFHALFEAACWVGLDKDDGGPAGVRSTIRSGLKAGARKPRAVPDFSTPSRAITAGRHQQGSGEPPVATMIFNCTDLGNAQRLVHWYGRDLHFVPAWGKWLVWSGTHWLADTTGAVQGLARDTLATIYTEASISSDTNERKALAKWAMASEAATKLEAMVKLAKAEDGIPVEHTQLDANPFLLNVRNGTIDLKTGQLLPHQREHLITKCLDVEYDPQVACPTWLKFLSSCMDQDQGMVDFLQRAVGYSLTGDVSEQCLFFMHGGGKNGKSKFTETLMKLLGSYAQKAPTEMLMEKRSGGGVPNDIARLPGARLAVAAEVEQGRRFSESVVKDLTGGDTLVARFMRQEFFEFQPTHKLWMYGNHKPVIKGTDSGIWRRIKLIPFTVRFYSPSDPDYDPAGPQADQQLGGKLEAEMAGILAWAVQGCLKWQQQGLGAPQKVQEATGAYRAEMDTLGDFLDECCVLTPRAQVLAGNLYQAYVSWCDENGEHPVSGKRFGMQLDERGFNKDRQGGTGKYRRLGIGLLAEGYKPSLGLPSGGVNDVDGVSYCEPDSAIPVDSEDSYREIVRNTSQQFIQFTTVHNQGTQPEAVAEESPVEATGEVPTGQPGTPSKVFIGGGWVDLAYIQAQLGRGNTEAVRLHCTLARADFAAVVAEAMKDWEVTLSA